MLSWLKHRLTITLAVDHYLMPRDSSDGPREAEQYSHSDQQKDGLIKGPWTTPIIQNDDEVPIGVSLYLEIEDLMELGIDTDNTTEIYYCLTDDKKIQLHEDIDS